MRPAFVHDERTKAGMKHFKDSVGRLTGVLMAWSKRLEDKTEPVEG